MNDCAACRYYDLLLRMQPSQRVVQVIADHVRFDHEPPG